LLPPTAEVAIQQQPPGNLEPEARAALRSLLDVIQRVGVEGEPRAVFEMIEQDLRARVSKTVSIEHSTGFSGRTRRSMGSASSSYNSRA